MRRIALTGATGFLGGRLAKTLADHESVEVLEVGRRPCGRGDQFLAFDLASSSPDRLADLRADAVIHVAAHIPDDQSAGGMRQSETVNGAGAIRLIEGCRRAGVERVVFASSCHLLDPRRPELVRNFYEGSKRSAERYLAVLAGRHCLSLLTLRLPYLYGSGMQHGRLFETLVRRARAGERIEVHNGGLARLRLLHVDDAVRAFLRAVGPAMDAEGTLNVAPRKPTAVREIAEMVVDAVDADVDIVPVGDPYEGPPVTLLDPPPAETRKQLGWEPRIPLRRGIADLVADAADGTPEGGP